MRPSGVFRALIIIGVLFSVCGYVKSNDAQEKENAASQHSTQQKENAAFQQKENAASQQNSHQNAASQQNSHKNAASHQENAASQQNSQDNAASQQQPQQNTASQQKPPENENAVSQLSVHEEDNVVYGYPTVRTLTDKVGTSNAQVGTSTAQTSAEEDEEGSYEQHSEPDYIFKYNQLLGKITEISRLKDSNSVEAGYVKHVFIDVDDTGESTDGIQVEGDITKQKDFGKDNKDEENASVRPDRSPDTSKSQEWLDKLDHSVLVKRFHERIERRTKKKELAQKKTDGDDPSETQTGTAPPIQDYPDSIQHREPNEPISIYTPATPPVNLTYIDYVEEENDENVEDDGPYMYSKTGAFTSTGYNDGDNDANNQVQNTIDKLIYARNSLRASARTGPRNREEQIDSPSLYTDENFQFKDRNKKISASNDNLSSVNDNQPSVNDYQPSVNDHNPSVNDHQPSVSDHHISVNNHPSSANDNQPSVNDHHPSVNDHPSSANDNRPSFKTRPEKQKANDKQESDNLKVYTDENFQFKDSKKKISAADDDHPSVATKSVRQNSNNNKQQSAKNNKQQDSNDKKQHLYRGSLLGGTVEKDSL